MTRTYTTFKRTIREYYKNHGRSTLPWRTRPTPYRVLVSELMLQQTQVERVIPKFTAFLKQFPTIRALACAPLCDVLIAWQGLGYNRRAKFLHQAALATVDKYGGKLPDTYEGLVELPGIGPYTAGAMCAFAYNKPVVLVETNIRTVFTHHFFPKRNGVHDSELLPHIEATLDRKNPSAWYAALMDYGSHLKRSGVRINNKSKHYTRQSKFKGSNREIRGILLRTLLKKYTSARALAESTGLPVSVVTSTLREFRREGLLPGGKKPDLVH